MAIKDAVTVKNWPHFWSSRTATTKLAWMNTLRKKEVKPSRSARARQGSDDWN